MAKSDDVERARALQALMNDINKRGKGRKLIASADEVPNTFTLRRPSGIAQLDIDTGGGLPAGGCCYISGPDNAGKTLLLWKYFAMQQRLFGKACTLAYAAVESAPDYFFARNCGVRVSVPDEMIEAREKARKEQGLPAFTKEELKELKNQVGTFHVVRGDGGEEILAAVRDLFESGLYNIVAVDSVSALVPADEIERELDEHGQQGAQASLLGRFAKKFYSLTNGLDKVNYTNLICTAQVRANRKKSEASSFMAKYIDEYATVGSYEMRHLKMIDILLRPGAYDKEGEKGKAKVTTGKTIRWKTQKGKAGTHDGIEGEYDIVFNDCTDDVRSLLVPAIRYGIIQQSGAHLTIGNERWSADDLTKRLREDFNAQMELRHKINAAAGITCTYT